MFSYVQSSALHCQIAKLLSQLERREVEKRELEANLILVQRRNQQALKERERHWGEQEASLLLRNQESQRMLREKETEVETKEEEMKKCLEECEARLALSNQQHQNALKEREKAWGELQTSYQSM